MNKGLTLLFLIGTITQLATAQSLIKGKLNDGSENSPIEFASVALYDQKDSTLIAGVVSDENGVFELVKLKPGNYYLHLQFMGLKINESMVSCLPKTGHWIWALSVCHQIRNCLMSLWYLDKK
jgi:hypothetical protein